MSRRLVSVADAAAYANLSPRTIRHYIAEGRLPGYRVGRRLVKVDLAELDLIIHKIPSAADSATVPSAEARKKRTAAPRSAGPLPAP